MTDPAASSLRASGSPQVHSTVGAAGAATVATSTRAAVLPVLVVAATYAVVGPTAVLAGVAALAALLTVVLRARMRLGLVAQALLAGLLFAIAVAVVTSAFVVPEPVPLGTLRRGWSATAFALLVVATSRLYVAQPYGGDSVTMAVALFALAACGGTISGPVFPAAVTLFLVTAVVARRLADPGRAPLRAVSARSILAATAGMGLAATFAWGSNIVLPEAHSWMVRQIMLAARPRSGFTTRIWLGSLQGLLLSDEVVLRLRGPRADYLRGHVYTEYYGGRWAAGPRDFLVVKSLPRALSNVEPERQTVVELVEDDPERYFLPLGAAEVAVPVGRAGVHRTGIVAPLAADPVDRYWFHQDGPRAHAVVGPTDRDVFIEPYLARQLARVSDRLTRHAGTDVARQLRAIERGLQTEYGYSLTFERSGEHDPVVGFLLHDRTGHCEYFASAMVLISRARGIPARLVGGYRVAEFNELGGYYIVRQRNAHTWVEAWVPGEGWRTYDPTPAAELSRSMPTTTPWTSAVGDLARTGWAALVRWLDQRTPLEFVGSLLTLVVLAIVARWLRARRQRAAADDGWRAEPPLECFVRLAEALAQRGLTREAHEPIEALARRVQRSELPAELRGQAAKLLWRYVALRYGGVGDPADLAAAVDELAARLQSVPARS